MSAPEQFEILSGLKDEAQSITDSLAAIVDRAVRLTVMVNNYWAACAAVSDAWDAFTSDEDGGTDDLGQGDRGCPGAA